jgi:hypothetical protein
MTSYGKMKFSNENNIEKKRKKNIPEMPKLLQKNLFQE